MFLECPYEIIMYKYKVNFVGSLLPLSSPGQSNTLDPNPTH